MGQKYFNSQNQPTSTALELEGEEPAEGEEAAENDAVTQTTFQYHTSGTATTSQLTAVTVAGTNDTHDNRYTYDAKGNITRYQLLDEDGDTVEDIYYHYDTANQLVREDNFRTNTTTRWIYDTAGNIRYRKEYAYTTAAIENWDNLTASKTVEYTYGDTSWGDLLTGYGAKAVTYDQIGNPETFGARAYTWEHGRQLKSLTEGTTTWNYTYDANGMRTGRTDGTTANTYTYIYTGSQLTQMKKGGTTFSFTYDANGVPLTFSYGNSTYYYATNLQGDVVALLRKTTTGMAVVGFYIYDAWGNCTISGNTTVLMFNPLRYRGYVYDQETGLYYLQSRYYDPEVGRFLNADGFTTTGQGFTGNNMFAYCLNSPVTLIDPAGSFPWPILPLIPLIPFVLSGCSGKDTSSTTNTAPIVYPSDFILSNNSLQNCYGFAFGIDDKKNPGDYSTPLPSDRITTLYANSPTPSIKDLTYLVMRDMAELGKEVRVIYDPESCQPDEYVVAAKIGSEGIIQIGDKKYADYHFAVLLSDGNWADKPGGSASRYNAMNGFEKKWDYNDGDGYYDSDTVYFAVKK